MLCMKLETILANIVQEAFPNYPTIIFILAFKFAICFNVSFHAIVPIDRIKFFDLSIVIYIFK